MRNNSHDGGTGVAETHVSGTSIEIGPVSASMSERDSTFVDVRGGHECGEQPKCMGGRSTRG